MAGLEFEPRLRTQKPVSLPNSIPLIHPNPPSPPLPLPWVPSLYILLHAAFALHSEKRAGVVGVQSPAATLLSDFHLCGLQAVKGQEGTALL